MMWVGGHLGGFVGVWACAHISGDVYTCVHVQTSSYMWLFLACACLSIVYIMWVGGYVGGLVVVWACVCTCMHALVYLFV